MKNFALIVMIVCFSLIVIVATVKAEDKEFFKEVNYQIKRVEREIEKEKMVGVTNAAKALSATSKVMGYNIYSYTYEQEILKIIEKERKKKEKQGWRFDIDLFGKEFAIYYRKNF